MNSVNGGNGTPVIVMACGLLLLGVIPKAIVAYAYVKWFMKNGGEERERVTKFMKLFFYYALGLCVVILITLIAA